MSVTSSSDCFYIIFFFYYDLLSFFPGVMFFLSYFFIFNLLIFLPAHRRLCKNSLLNCCNLALLLCFPSLVQKFVAAFYWLLMIMIYQYNILNILQRVYKKCYVCSFRRKLVQLICLDHTISVLVVVFRLICNILDKRKSLICCLFTMNLNLWIM